MCVCRGVLKARRELELQAIVRQSTVLGTELGYPGGAEKPYSLLGYLPGPLLRLINV